MRKSTLLAVVFANGLVTSAGPATAENIDTSISIIKQVSDDKQATAVVRAFRLLLLAFSYLDCPDKKALEEQELRGLGQYAKFRLKEQALIFVIQGVSRSKYSLKSETTKDANSADQLSLKQERFCLSRLEISTECVRAIKR